MQCLHKTGVIAAIILICLFLIPIEVTAQKRRIKNRYTLKGLLSFRYERFSTDGNKRNYFGQTYDLTLLGPIWHPRFMEFQTDVSFSQVSKDSEQGPDETIQLRRFGLITTFLPKFNYPLTLYFRKITNENSIDQERTNYGFKWRFRSRKRMPNILLFFDKTDISVDNRDLERINFGVDIDKRIKRGPTDTMIRYTSTISEQDSSESQSHGISFDNRTKLTKTAFFTLGGNLVFTESADRTTNFFSARTTLSFIPSRKLRHFYRYNLNFRDYEDGEAITHALGATLYYRATSRLSLRESLIYDRHDTTRRTLSTTFQRFRFRSGLDYRLTNYLSTFVNVSYYDYWWDPEDPVTKERSVKTYGVSVGLSYVRPTIRNATFSSSYAIGFETIDSDRFESTTDVTHSFRIGVDGMDFRYYTLSSSYALNVNTTDREDYIHYEKTEHTFNINAQSKDLRYLTLSGGYTYYMLDSRLKELDEDLQEIKIYANSKYFRRTNITAFYGYSNVKKVLLERTKTHSFNTNINHFIFILRGILRLSAGYGTVVSSTPGGTTRTTNINYEGSYSARITRNLSMELMGRRDEFRYGATESNTTRFRTKFIYRLRAWTIDTFYEYRLTDRTGYTTTENRFMINASRAFRRIFYR